MKPQKFVFKFITGTGVLILFLMVGCSEKITGKHTKEYKAVSVSSIENLIKEWEGMWNSYDLSMVDNLFLQDSRLTYFSSEKEGVIRGIEAVKEHHKEFGFVAGGKVQDNKLWVEDIHVELFNDTSIVTGIWYFQRGSEDTPNLQHGPLTFVCVKDNEEFRLMHLNFAEYLE